MTETGKNQATLEATDQNVDKNEPGQTNRSHKTQTSITLKPNELENNEIEPTKKRHFILFIFCMQFMINGAQWIYLSSISVVVARFYKVSDMAVNWTSMSYMMSYIVFVVPATWLTEKLGLRYATLLGSTGTTLGATIKCFSCQPGLFYLLMIGQIIVATCQTFVLNVPPRLASVWFPDNQASMATACGVFGGQLGSALGFLVPQLVVGGDPSSAESTEAGLFSLFVGIAAFSALTTVLIFFFFDEAPPKAPGLARLQQIKKENAQAQDESLASAEVTSVSVHEEDVTANTDFRTLLWVILTNKNFLLLLVGFGIKIGVFCALSTVLNQMISLNWPTAASITGNIGLTLIVSGMFGSAAIGYITSEFHDYNLIKVSVYACSLVSLIMFALALQLKNKLILFLAALPLGFFVSGYQIICYEVSSEIMWPAPENVTACLLNLSVQIFGVVLTYVGALILELKGSFAANTFFISVVLVGFPLVWLIDAKLKRQHAMGA